MKAVLLCAGFATRLYPLTQDQPKSLLSIAGEPLLNHLIRRMEAISDLTEIILVSNGKFESLFNRWARELETSKRIRVVSDGTMDNEHRLGAIRDLALAIERGAVHEDVLVLAGDNLIDAELTPFISFAKAKKPAASLGIFDIGDLGLARKYGLVETDTSDRITRFLEKPDAPPTTWASTGIYFLPRETLMFISRYLETSKNPDAPGYYMSWLANEIQMYAFRFGGTWFDIGDLASYRKADRYFESKKNHEEKTKKAL